jgi:predicted KAP-like P-loop ATPase
MADEKRPFTMDYVLRTTQKHMIKSIETSIKKTMDRMPEFADDQPKAQEIFHTLGYLHNIKNRVINEFNYTPEK